MSGPSKLRIAIDATCLGSARGYGRYLRELLPGLVDNAAGHEIVLVLDPATAEKVGPLPAPTLQPPTSTSQAGAASARGNRSLRDMWAMGRAVARENFDLAFFPSVYSFFPVFGGTKVAVCLHDVIAERHGQVVFPTWRNRLFWNAKVRFALRQASGVLTVSEWSRGAIAEHFGLAAERIFVSGEAPSASFSPVDDPAEHRRLLADHGVPADARHLIYVGGFNPHKNLRRMIEALARVPNQESLHLLLVGDYEGDVFHAEVETLRDAIDHVGLGERVHWLGFVPDDDLRHLYAGSVALVLPSLEEGFGLPAAEAAACGTPCVATQNSPLPQVLEGGGLFVDPSDGDAIANALGQIAGDEALRARLAAGALSRVAEMSWRNAADRTIAALETIARGSE